MLTFKEFVDRHMHWKYGGGGNVPLAHKQVAIVDAISEHEKLFFVGPRKVGASSIAAALAVYDAAIMASRVVVTGPTLLHAWICFDIAKSIVTSGAMPQGCEVEKITRKEITFSSGGSISICSVGLIAGSYPGFTCIVEHARSIKAKSLNDIAAIAGRVVAISTGSDTPYYPADLGSAWHVRVMQEVAV